MRPNEQTQRQRVADADARFVEWMRLNLDRAADHFGLQVTGEPVYGWRLRTIGAPATGDQGDRWLRVVTEFPEWAHGDTWTGNTDANTLVGMAKPRVVGVYEWDEQNWRHQRAEVLTLLPGRAISPTNQLQAVADLPGTWWAELRATIDALRATPTTRTSTTAERVAARTRDTYGTAVHVGLWETVHGDLHWENLLAPQFGLVDWELWGGGPAGTDAATLLLYSLLVPEVAARVHDTFADHLDTEAGRTAQLAVAARLLSRIADGDFPELADPIRAHVRGLGVIARMGYRQVFTSNAERADALASWIEHYNTHAATAHSEDAHQPAACHQPDGRVQLGGELLVGAADTVGEGGGGCPFEFGWSHPCVTGTTRPCPRHSVEDQIVSTMKCTASAIRATVLAGRG